MLASTSEYANGLGLLRGQLAILLHRQLRVRRRLEVELVGRGYSVLPLDTERDLVAYLDGAERPLTIDDGFRKRLGVARILCRPYTPDDVAAAVEAILPPAYSDESGGRS